MDQLTRILNIFTKNILISHPLRTSLGGVLGGVIYVLIDVLSPLLIGKFSSYVDFTRFSIWHCILLGIFVLHIRTLYKLLFKPSSTELDENISQALSLIEQTQKDKTISKRRREDLYMEVIRKVLERRQLNPEIQKEINKPQ